jgi:hypothetical protein
MTLWVGLIVASLIVWAVKNAGYVIPQRVVESALISRIALLVTVALLASLVASQGLQNGGLLVVDARLPAVAVAGILLYFRAPFVVVLLAAGVVAAALRVLGVMI